MRFVAVVLALLVPVPVLALSCAPHAVANVYERAAQSEDVYVVVKGRMTFDERKLPTFDASNPDDATGPVTMRARMVGKMMSQQAFDQPFDAPVTMIVQCFGPWCGAAKSGGDYLAFLKRTGGAFSVVITPCGGDVFPEPRPAHIKQVLDCHQGRRCTAVKY